MLLISYKKTVCYGVKNFYKLIQINKINLKFLDIL